MPPDASFPGSLKELQELRLPVCMREIILLGRTYVADLDVDADSTARNVLSAPDAADCGSPKVSLREDDGVQGRKSAAR